MREEEADWITAARGNGYTAVEDVWRRAGLEARTLTILAEADAFAALGLTRREALWAARALVPKGELPLFAGDLDGEGIVEGAVVLPQMTEGEEVVEDYVAMRLTLRSHPVALVRHRLSPGIEALACLRQEGRFPESGIAKRIRSLGLSRHQQTSATQELKMNLSDKVAFVTGASGGLGRAIAEHLADAGTHIAIGYRTGTERAEATADAVRAKG
jgi:DNA polymerase III alpha subunit